MKERKTQAQNLAQMSVVRPSVAKRLRVVGLRKQGLSLSQIGNEVGVSRQAVSTMLKRHQKNVDSGKWPA